MKKILKISKRKILGAMGGSGLAIAIGASTVFGAEVSITGNGSRSDNSISFRSSNTTSIRQSNNADISNFIRVNSNTGNNSADGNTRGDVSIRTGDSNATVGVSNLANFNYASVEGCGECDRDIRLRISGNGRGSDNTIRFDSDSAKRISQENWARFFNRVRVDSNTGYNTSNDNTKGDYDNHSGDSDSKVHVNNSANYNEAEYKKDHEDRDDHDYGKDKDHEGDDMNNVEEKIAHMTGHQEVPGPGDPDGKGHANVWLHHDTDQVCAHMHVENIAPATAAHIHKGKPGEAGPVVVPLPTPDHNGHAEGCVDASHEIVHEIHKNPHDYYVNVHNNEYPEGAIRGQLSNL